MLMGARLEKVLIYVLTLKSFYLSLLKNCEDITRNMNDSDNLEGLIFNQIKNKIFLKTFNLSFP